MSEADKMFERLGYKILFEDDEHIQYEFEGLYMDNEIIIYKKGKTNQLNIYNFWVQTGLEKLIRNCQRRKENVLNNVCQYITKEDWLSL